MPSAVTNLTLTQPTVGDPKIVLAWEHDDTDLDRFEISFRAEDEVWESPEPLIFQAADLGGSGEYEATLSSPPGVDWAVRAISADGTVST